MTGSGAPRAPAPGRLDGRGAARGFARETCAGEFGPDRAGRGRSRRSGGGRHGCPRTPDGGAVGRQTPLAPAHRCRGRGGRSGRRPMGSGVGAARPAGRDCGCCEQPRFPVAHGLAGRWGAGRCLETEWHRPGRGWRWLVGCVRPGFREGAVDLGAGPAIAVPAHFARHGARWRTEAGARGLSGWRLSGPSKVWSYLGEPMGVQSTRAVVDHGSSAAVLVLAPDGSVLVTEPGILLPMTVDDGGVPGLVLVEDPSTRKVRAIDANTGCKLWTTLATSARSSPGDWSPGPPAATCEPWTPGPAGCSGADPPAHPSTGTSHRSPTATRSSPSTTPAPGSAFRQGLWPHLAS
jgi:hypothetical protein